MEFPNSSYPLPFDLVVKLAKAYIEVLGRRPILVKSITSGLIGAIGNYVAQQVGKTGSKGQKLSLNLRSMAAFGIFGFGISGPLVHYFLNWLAIHGPSNPILKVLVDRFGFGPLYLSLLLYLLPRLEGKTHSEAKQQLEKLYWSALKMSWKIWIPVQFVNLNLVPLQYRVLVTNLVSVGWNIYLSRKRSLEEAEKLPKPKESED